MMWLSSHLNSQLGQFRYPGHCLRKSVRTSGAFHCENSFPHSEGAVERIRTPNCQLLLSAAFLVPIEKLRLRGGHGTSCVEVSLQKKLGLWVLENWSPRWQKRRKRISCCCEGVLCLASVGSLPASGSDKVIGSTCVCPIGRDAMTSDRAFSWTTRSWYSPCPRSSRSCWSEM